MPAQASNNPARELLSVMRAMPANQSITATNMA